MKSLYLILNLASISIPLAYSFHPKLQFYKQWKPLFLSIFITGSFYIIWDIMFTINGIWGFNEAYFLGLKILKLPLEELLFFLCIPYACVFTHYALLHYFPNLKLNSKITTIISYLLTILFVLVAVSNYSKWYTFVNFIVATLVLVIGFLIHKQILQSYFITFLVMLIPFFIVNGILTGSFINGEVVWYNNHENLGLRLFTIPIEDSVYAFSLILSNLILMKLFRK